MSNSDLVFAFVPLKKSERPHFQDWLNSLGKEALYAITGAQKITAFQTVEGPEGIQILLDVPNRPLKDGVTDAVLTTLKAFSKDGPAKNVQVGRFVFSHEETGVSKEAKTGALLVVGRAAGTNHLDEFRAWYEEEHMVGLALLEGVISIKRYDNLADPSESLAIYDLVDENVPKQSGWPLVGHTPWTRRIRSKYRKWLDFRSRLIATDTAGRG